MQLEATYFCGQECFTGFWKFHKLAHVKKQVVKETGNFAGPLRPFPYSIKGHRDVSKKNKKPDYARTGEPNASFQELSDKSCPIHDAADLAGIKAAARLAREALDAGHAIVKVGVTTEAIDIAVHEYITSRGGYPSPLNYYGFPRSCCTSINEIICHGIPDTRPLEDGDIVNLDVTAYLNGYHGDLNETYCVGNVNKRSKDLIIATYESL